MEGVKRWRVLQTGASLEKVLGTEVRNNREREIITVVVGRAGDIIEGDLAANFTQRYEAGEEFARSLVERVDAEGNPVEGVEEDTADFGEQLAALPDRIASETDVDSLVDAKEGIEDAREALEAASTQIDDRITELQAAAEEAESESPEEGSGAGGDPDAPPGGGDTGAGDTPFDPDEHTVEEVNDHLSSATDEERERVLAAERAGKNRTSVNGIEG